MRNAIFVAPYLLETTARFVQGAAALPETRLGLVTHEPEEKVPQSLRGKLADYLRVENALDAGQLGSAVRHMSKRLGSVDRLIGTLEELQVPLAEVREAFGIPGMRAEAARNFRDKSRMKSVLQAHGIPCARHRLVSGPDEARAFAREASFPLVVKPPAGAGARNTFRIDDDTRLGQWLAAAPPTRENPALLEEFLTGEEHSFDSVMVEGRLIFHSISRYLPTPLQVLETPWIQWCVILPREIDGPEYDAIRTTAARALAVLGMETGLSHMEWFRKPDGGVAISEVAARPPGAQFTTLLSYAHDLDFYGAWARLAVYDEFPVLTRRWAVGAAFLRGQGSGRVRAVHGLEKVAKEVGPVVVEARFPKPGQSSGGGYEGDGYVVVRHRDTEAVERALARIVTGIRVELE
jgi:formate-dependent phosphoribosylglycinamide formyltransferase (GAR transformylase)